MNTAIPTSPSIPHARKMLYDYLDDNRPWASTKDVYAMMEAIVDYAAFAFRDEIRPTKEDVRKMGVHLLRFTLPLTEHPENYDGPCDCAECRSSGE